MISKRPVSSDQWSAVGGQRSRNHSGAARSAAFTLIEMLIVIAIIAILSALTLPALRGLAGSTGLRGGVNTVMATLDQARASAIESGVSVYVGFPPPSFADPQDPYLGHSSMIVFRRPRPGESADPFKPLSRWIRLPSGIAVMATNMSLPALPDSPATYLPKLAGQQVSPVVIEYDRFGRIKTAVSSQTNLIVGEAIASATGVQWKGGNQEILTAQRLTGRWLLSRP